MASSSPVLAFSGAVVALLAWITGPAPEGTTAVVQAAPAPPSPAAGVPLVAVTPTPSLTSSPTPTPPPSPAPKPPASPAPSTPPPTRPRPATLVVTIVDENGATLDRSYVVQLFEDRRFEPRYEWVGLALEHGYFGIDAVPAGEWLVYSVGCDGETGTADDLTAYATVFAGQSTDLPIPDKPCPPGPTATETPSDKPTETPSEAPSSTASPTP